MGHDLAAAILERVPLVAEDAGARFAAEIGRWLAGHLKEKRIPFTFRITAEQALNAFALPGGHVFLSEALLKLCQRQRDEIAFVLAHEMGHIVLRHTLDRVVRDSVFSWLLRQSSGKNAAGAWLERVGRQALIQAYSRDSELEADRFAVSLIKTCGGDVLAGQNLLQKLAQQAGNHGEGSLGEFFATHPPLAERLAQLRSLPSA